MSAHRLDAVDDDVDEFDIEADATTIDATGSTMDRSEPLYLDASLETILRQVAEPSSTSNRTCESPRGGTSLAKLTSKTMVTTYAAVCSVHV